MRTWIPCLSSSENIFDKNKLEQKNKTYEIKQI